MLLVWRTPPTSDLFDAPARNRFIVVSLLPNASRKAQGKVAASNGSSASSVIACSISTAFNLFLRWRTHSFYGQCTKRPMAGNAQNKEKPDGFRPEGVHT